MLPKKIRDGFRTLTGPSSRPSMKCGPPHGNPNRSETAAA
jgi:hypothetical protein